MNCAEPTSKNPPHLVLHHQIVLILSSTVDGLQIDIFFTQSRLLKKKVLKLTFHSIVNFTCLSSFSEMKLIYLRMTSQIIPNTEHFLVIRGSDGVVNFDGL